MIASLSGVAEFVALDHAVIDVGGVGYLVHATPGTLGALRVGERAHLKTVQVVREDSLTLYAFADADERAVFATATTVSGVGPKIGLALLAVHSPEAIRLAVHTQDVKAFTKVPGIGPKVAQRVLLELGGKLAPPEATTVDGGDGGQAAQGGALPTPDASGQVTQALVALGYNNKAAEAAVEAHLKAEGVTSVAPADVSAVLRAVLRGFGGGR